jgi:hypothetical protein
MHLHNAVVAGRIRRVDRGLYERSR